MGKKKPIAQCKSIELFRMIEECTRVVVRMQCKNTKLTQEIRLERKSGNEVDGYLKEFGGTKFRVRINLAVATVMLVSPDYTWLSNADSIPALVSKWMAEVLTASPQLQAFTVTREIDRLAC